MHSWNSWTTRQHLSVISKISTSRNKCEIPMDPALPWRVRRGSGKAPTPTTGPFLSDKLLGTLLHIAMWFLCESAQNSLGVVCLPSGYSEISLHQHRLTAHFFLCNSSSQSLETVIYSQQTGTDNLALDSLDRTVFSLVENQMETMVGFRDTGTLFWEGIRLHETWPGFSGKPESDKPFFKNPQFQLKINFSTF